MHRQRTIDPHGRASEGGAGITLTARALWHGSCVARQNRHVRRTRRVCVVGGAQVIERVWRTYGIRPRVVYIPQCAWKEESCAAAVRGREDGALPHWCVDAHYAPRPDEAKPIGPTLQQPSDATTRNAEEACNGVTVPGEDETDHTRPPTPPPTFIVRAPAADIRRVLLSASHSDGYAAEFPHSGVLTLSDLATTEPSLSSSPGGAVGATTAVHSVLVLVGVRIPSNVGTLLRAAVDLCFHHVVCVNCVDVLHEKVIRASGGAVLDSRLRVYEHRLAPSLNTEASSVVPLLTAVAQRHALHPILAVPSQSVPSASTVAARLGFGPAAAAARVRVEENRECAVEGGEGGGGAAAPLCPHGVMLVLGAESGGLSVLAGGGNWAGVRYSVASLPLPNPFTDSYNVAVAGSTLMHLFRRAVRPAARPRVPAPAPVLT